ncbi:hypothetical protein F4814DRAFT_200159, partial [Daldinia grandis]
NIDQYFPPNTLEWCKNYLKSIQLDCTREDNHNYPFVQAYNKLRTAIQIQFDNSNPLGLTLSPPPLQGGLARLKKRLVKFRNFATENEIEEGLQEADLRKQQNGSSCR